MNAKFKQIIVVAGVMGILFLSVVSYAQSFDNEPERGARFREKMIDNLSRELNLTPQQQEQIRKEGDEHRKKNKELRSKYRMKRLELSKELEKKDVDKKKIYNIVAEITILQRDLLEQRVNKILSMREILSPEQFEKLQEKKKMHEAFRRGLRKGRKERRYRF